MNGPTAIPLTINGSTVIAVGKGATVYTDVRRLDGLDTFALVYKAACAATPNVKIEMEQGIIKPSPQNEASGDFVVPEIVQPLVESLTDKNLHIVHINPVAVPYIRFKITELTDVNEDTVLTMHLSVQNRY